MCQLNAFLLGKALFAILIFQFHEKPTPPLSFDFIASSERGILNDEILSLSASPASHDSPSLPAFPATVVVRPPWAQFLLTSAFLPSAVSISGIAK